MAEVIELRPEVLELVREIAKRPDSVLLRVNPGTELRELSEDRSWVTGSESGLSRAERHLVEVYREEVAFALRQVAWVALCAVNAGRGPLLRRQSVTLEAERPEARSAAVRVTQALRDTPEGVVDGSTRELLEACTSLRGERSQSVVRLCTAAQRMNPSFHARHHVAAWYALHGRGGPALLAAKSALRLGHGGLYEAATWTLVADVASQSRRWNQAAHAGALATIAHPELISPYLVKAWSAIHSEDEARANWELSELARLVDGQLGSLTEHIDRIVGMHSTLRESMSPTSVRVLRRIVDGPVRLAGVIFHAVQ